MTRPCPACAGSLRPLFEKDGKRYDRCGACGSAFAEVPPGEPARYHDYLPEATLTLPEPTRKRYRELLASFAPFRTSGRLLDVGCGSAFFVEEAAAAGWTAEGTEVSMAAVEFAAKRGLRVHPGILRDAPVEPGSLDVLTLFEVLEHVPSPDGILGDAARLLRPGGALYLTTPNFGSLSRRILGADWSVISRDHVSLYTAKGLLAAVRRARFRPLRTSSRNILPHEIRRAFRPRGSGSAGPDPARTTRLQATLESRRSLSFLKSAVNAVLSATGTGDTLVLLAGGPP
jgi:2-polyprenyl-3-methyl-5-hydroxy-6-metoxy-1,4-benzoquinol methylase